MSGTRARGGPWRVHSGQTADQRVSGDCPGLALGESQVLGSRYSSSSERCSRLRAEGSREKSQDDPRGSHSPEAAGLALPQVGPTPPTCTPSLMTLHLACLSSMFAQCQLQSPRDDR